MAVNMVITLDGRVSMDGKASPIGSSVDRLIMSNVRCAADAILVGAGTVRAEEMNLIVPAELSRRREANGLSPQPMGVILAGSGELPLERKVFRSSNQRIAVIAGEATPQTTLAAASDLGARVFRVPGSRLPKPPDVLRLLKELLNVSTVLLEGGPTVNGAFFSSGAVDELFLTLSPKISGSPRDALPIAATDATQKPPTSLRLVSAHSSPEESELYLRYHVLESPSGFR